MIPNMVPPKDTELEGQDDLSKGHKVVAMPTSAFGGMSVRDVVSSRNGDRPEQHKPRRSRSAGRTVSRPRDIVQDVYDRMGISYARGRPSLDLLVDDRLNSGTVISGGTEARNANATPTRGRQASRNDLPPQSADRVSGRGRSEQVDPERERRARSLSRGRMQQRWQTAVTTKDPSPVTHRRTLTGSGYDEAAPSTPVPAPKPVATATTTTTTPVRQAPKTPVRQAPITPVRPAAALPVRQTPTSNNVGSSQSDAGPSIFSSATTTPAKESVFSSFRSPPPQQTLARSQSFSRDYASNNIERREYASSERRDLPCSDKKRQSAAATLSQISTPDLKDEKKEDDSMSEESKGAQRRLSIKDRISAYREKGTPPRTGVTTSRPRRSFSTFSSPQYTTKRELLPPKMDIYGTESDARTVISSEIGTGNAAPLDAARAAVEAAPDPPVEKNNRLSTANSVSGVSLRSARTTGRVADAFLAAISPVMAPPSPRTSRGVPKSIPVMEIDGNPAEETGAVDAQSLAASSVSGDEYINSHSVVVGLPMKKNSLKPDIHKYGPTRNVMTGMTISSLDNGYNNNANNNNNSYNSNTPTITPEMEKRIEDRVQAQLSDMESRFEARLARIETKVENQHKEHVEALEVKLDQLSSLLMKMTAAGSGSGPSSTSVANKGPGDKKLLMLLSNQSGNRQQVADQNRAQTLFKVQRIDAQLLDGSVPANKPRRDELFGISGIRANYPQFFLVGDSCTTFLGNFDTIESMNDRGTLTNGILDTC